MFRHLTVEECFPRVASEEEWQAFTSLKPADSMDLWIFAMDSRPTQRGLEVERYRALWERFASEVRSRLLSGEWTAAGYMPSAGAHPLPIDSSLWRVLKFDLLKNSASGEGFTFVNLLISCRRSDAPIGHASKAGARAEVRRWMEALPQSQPGPLTKEQVRNAAKVAFAEMRISDHLFNEAWKEAHKPAGFVHRGRPKV